MKLREKRKISFQSWPREMLITYYYKENGWSLPSPPVIKWGFISFYWEWEPISKFWFHCLLAFVYKWTMNPVFRTCFDFHPRLDPPPTAHRCSATVQTETERRLIPSLVVLSNNHSTTPVTRHREKHSLIKTNERVTRYRQRRMLVRQKERHTDI